MPRFNQKHLRLKPRPSLALFLLPIILSSALFQTPCQAESEHALYRLNLGISIAHGGDDLVHVSLENNRGAKISAGNGASAFVGLFFDRQDANLNFLINTGIFEESKASEETSIDLRRYFIDGLMLYQAHRFHRISLGFSGHFSNRLNIHTETLNDEIKFKPALGYILQYEYIFQSKNKGIPSIGLRYVGINYIKEDDDQERYDASHIGLSLNYIF
ncbi:MAG: hypothetical protein HRU20_14155 [Pseudomonadales bacterium]|nr:hypothetical protein [Pseudomonadales bacterium]